MRSASRRWSRREAGCCGAIRHHLDDHEGGAATHARRNIDAWWPHVDPARARVEAIVMNASGCGAMVKEYGAPAPQRRSAYAEKARRIVSADARPERDSCRDSMPRRCAQRVRTASQRVAFHPPCTLQHGQKIRGEVESLLARAGRRAVRRRAERAPVLRLGRHLLGAAAGAFATTLRDRKLDAPAEAGAAAIVSANIGCIAHLQSGTATPVRHWIEWLDERLTDPG